MISQEEIQTTLDGIRDGDHALTEGGRRVLLEVVEHADHLLLYTMFQTILAIKQKSDNDLDFIQRNN